MAKVFFSYSHKDRSVKEKIDQHFSILKRTTVIDIWSDNEIPAGAYFDKVIKEELEEADIILLLVTANFLASDYCHDIEMKRSLEKHRNCEAKVVPIILDVCDWKHTELGRLNALPTDGREIKKYGNRSEAYQNITDGIRCLAQTVNSPKNQILKAAILSKNTKISSTTSLLIKTANFVKKHIKPIGVTAGVSLVLINLPYNTQIPHSLTLQQEAENQAFYQTPGKEAIEHDFNKDGVLDKVSYLSSYTPTEHRGLYIFLSDVNSTHYSHTIKKTGGIWSSREDVEYTWISLDGDDLIINFNAFMSSNLDYKVKLKFMSNVPIISGYKRFLDGNLICNINYLSGEYTIHGNKSIKHSQQISLINWHRGLEPFECLF